MREASLLRWGLLCLLVLNPSSSFAEGPRQVALDYSVGEGAGDCPSRAALMRAVSERLGYQPFVSKSAELVRVQLSAKATLYSAHVSVRDASGAEVATRRVAEHVAGCDQLIAALALSISLALDPDAVDRLQLPRRARERGEGKRPRQGLSPSALQRAPVSRPPAPEVEALAGTWSAGAALGATWGGAPGALPLLRALVEYRRAWWSLGLELNTALPVAQEALGGALHGSRVAVGISGCGHAAWFRGCVLLAGGGLWLSSTGFVNARRVSVAELGLAGRVGLLLPLSEGVSLALSAELELPLLRTQAWVGGERLWSTSELGFSATLGPRWRL